MSFLSGIGFKGIISDAANPLGDIFKRAYGDLIIEMNDFKRTPWQRERARAMLVRVDNITKKLDADTQAYLKRTLPEVYFTTAKEIKKDLRTLNLTIPEEFSQIHFEAIEAAAQDAVLKFGQTMTGVRRSAEGYVQFAAQQATREIIAAGQLSGASAKEIAADVADRFAQDGFTAFIDKGGKKWKLDAYGEMLARQIMANAGREGVRNTAQEYGLDLVQITRHGTACEFCAPWESEIVSLSGKTPGYKSLDAAVEAGLLHVNCRHGYYVVTNVSRPKAYIPDNDASYETIRVGDMDLDVRGGDFHRIVDQKEYAYMLNTAQLAPTPKGLFGHGDDDNKKFFGIDANVGKLVTASTKFEQGARYQLVVNVKDMPQLFNDPKMKGASVYVTEPIPVSKIRARKL